MAVWTELFRRWARRRGFLTGLARTRVTGTVRVDGATPGLVWVALIPEHKDHPLARTRINRDSQGVFEIALAGGVVPGTHRLEVHIVSDQSPHLGTGIYSMADKRSHTSLIEIAPDQHLELTLSREDFDD